MATKYFARFAESRREIAVFNTQEERDAWVNYEDEFSRFTHTTPENAPFHRISLSEDEARECSAGRIYNVANYYPDTISDNITWVEIPWEV